VVATVFRVSVAAAILIVSSVGLRAAFNPETGTALFHHFSPKQYGASPQNWSITQDGRGILYFANTDGVLEFDGIDWRVLHLPAGIVARSVATGDDQTVYVGAVGDFGFLKSDSNGITRYVSLKNKVPKQDRGFADVWKVFSTDQGIYFSTTARLFRLNHDGSIKVWSPQKKFGRAFYVLNSVYVQSNNVGLTKLDGSDKLTPIPGGERFASDVVYAAAAQSDGNAILATASSLSRLTTEGVTPYPTQGDGWLADSIPYSLLVLPDGELAIGSRKGGLALMNRKGEIDRILSTSSGLADDFVSDMHRDPQGGVWVTMNNGISRYDPALSKFGSADSLSGDVQTVARRSADLYAGSTTGLFRLVQTPERRPVFEKVDGISGGVWSLDVRSAGLLAGTDLGLFEVNGKRAVRVYESTRSVLDISDSPKDPNTVYIARRLAVTVLQRKGSAFSKTAEFEAPGEEFRSVLEAPDSRVWATTKGNIWRFDFRTQPVTSEKFGTAEGVPEGWINARRLNGHIVFATDAGLKFYDETRKTFVPDPELGTEFSDGTRDVFNTFDDPSGNIWVTGKNYHVLLLKQAKGYKPFPMPLLQSGIAEIYWMWLDPDGTVWATGADFVLHRWERGLAGNPDNDFRVLNRRVQLIDAQKDWYGGDGGYPTAKLPWRDNALRFEFAAPFYEEPLSAEYQVRLEGSDGEWTPWSHETRRDYTHLPEGTYKFHVRARTPHGAVAEDASLNFGVLPPWYRTWWAYASYVVLGGFGIWGIVGVRTRQLEADKRRLEHIVEERTIEVRKQRDEIHEEQQKSQSLLLNILPAKVADELKSTGSVQPVGFDDVTVCFTDFVGFTLSSETMAPGSLVDALNEYFTRFDQIIARYGLEKLKTIGDSYMFASGLPAARKAHAVDAVLAALEMVEVVKQLGRRNGSTGWNIRVGLHSGPVVAGVVGTSKFAFDIWGNTVNFAARMESSGVPGRVNLSEHTFQLTHGLIDCEFRGQVRIKEGRELPMYLAREVTGEFPDKDLEEGIPVTFAARYKQEFGETPRSFPAVLTNVAQSSRS
jgi:class 3 adenylate cyclase